MHKLAHKLSQGPDASTVYDRMERHAEHQKEGVRNGQVEDEQVGSVPNMSFVLQHNHYDQDITDAAQDDYNGEEYGHNNSDHPRFVWRALPVSQREIHLIRYIPVISLLGGFHAENNPSTAKERNMQKTGP